MKKTTRLPASEVILYGADYNPDQWLGQERVLAEDLELMKKAGVTSVSIGIFAWTALEPAPGVYDFGWLDETMDRFAAAGMKVFLATPSGSKPMWLSETHPEVRRVGLDSRRETSGWRHNHCPTSPVYREAVQRINRGLALRYGNHPALALWHVGNELSGECHCALCRTAFHDWLRRRYGTLEELNRAWWTSFWNHTLTDWSQVPTHDRSIDALSLDWMRFVNDQHCSFLENEMAPLRELTPGIPCTTNFMGTHPTTNYWQWSKLLDCVSNDLYPIHADREDGWKKSLGSDFTHSLMRGLAQGDPWILMECSPSSVNWGTVNKLKRPGVHRQEVLQAVANGADVIHYFQWRKGRGGREKFHGAVVDHEGSSRSRVFRECTEVGQILQQLAPVAGVRPDRAPVAMVFDWESRWALAASSGPKQTSGELYTGTCHDHFRALRTAGIEVDIVPPEADLSGYRAVITPALYLLREDDAQKFTAFVEGGGAWVATYLTGYVDEHNRCWCGGFPGPNLREVFGLWNEEIDYLFDDKHVRIEGCIEGLRAAMRATDVVEVLHAEGATPMATAASEFYAGAPVILRHRWKKGSTHYLGARLDDESLVAFYRTFASELGLPRTDLPRGVVRKTRLGSAGPVDFLFNYTRHAVGVDLEDEKFCRVSDGSDVAGRTTLRPYETLLRGGTPQRPTPTAMKSMHSPRPTKAKLRAFTLIELLVVIGIIGVLAAIALPVLNRVRASAAQSKSVSALRSVLQAATLYTGENSGQIPTMRYAGENLILNPGGKWVANTFWGRLQPYLFPEITTNDQKQLNAELQARLKNLFGSRELDKMTGTPFEGARIYKDTSGLPVPFASNVYLKTWNQWVTQQQIYSLPATIYVTFGFGAFDEVDAQTYQPMDTTGGKPENNIYYLPSKQAIAGFLDGRVEFLTPPIAEKMVKIDGTGQ